ncbi:hypothetical protein WJX81_003952 [Elliptochloris bilobata]|uniref:tRNA-5-taurinomethyluridine 2-sulfurtransferase n=1 Tax=Elliptochloris bilobata TaxID=381761 RepID=A0AAW1SCN5_9CHLO
MPAVALGGDLGVDGELVVPALLECEDPASVLVVRDDEVGVKRYVSPEEAAAAADAAAVAAAAAGGAAAAVATRALADMMGGGLDTNAAAIACAAPRERPAWMAGNAAAFTKEQASEARAWEERERIAIRERERLLGIAAAETRALQGAAAEACAGIDEAIAALDQEGSEADRAFRRVFADAGALLPALTALYRRRALRRNGGNPNPNPPATPQAGEAPERANGSGSSARAMTPEGEAFVEPLLAPGSRPEGCSDAWCEPDGPRLRVALLLSGGVDSSLALRLLQAAGHAVTAFYLQIWFQEDFRNTWDACPWQADVDVARQVCEAAGVALEVVPLTQEYWHRVVSHCLAETRAGRTPNPDVLCNSRVKFGAFYEHLEARNAAPFDRIASGHYAQLLRLNSGSETSTSGSDAGSSDGEPAALLALTRDAVKDQTYFLAGLSRQQLARAMFPLGPLTKAEVRRLAAEAGLPNQARPDSQGICFLGKVRFGEFLREHLGTWPGALVDEESGAVLGLHDGFWFFTPGQRRGIGLPGGPWYVARKDAATNTVYVSRAYYAPDKRRDAFLAGSLNWLTLGPLSFCGPLRCKVAVFYRDSLCLGSAVIEEALETALPAAALGHEPPGGTVM